MVIADDRGEYIVQVDTPCENSEPSYDPVQPVDVVSDHDSETTLPCGEAGETLLCDAVDRALDQFEVKEAKRLVKELEARERFEMQETEKLIKDYEVISLDAEHEPAIDEGFEVLELPL